MFYRNCLLFYRNIKNLQLYTSYIQIIHLNKQYYVMYQNHKYGYTIRNMRNTNWLNMIHLNSKKY